MATRSPRLFLLALLALGIPLGACDCNGTPKGPGDGAVGDGSNGDGSNGDGQVTVGCGSGTLDTGELCDDGNTAANDGCDPTCTMIAPGYQCFLPGAPCVLCGDGTRAQFEGCDDGNVANGDGCSSTCSVEPGYTCGLSGTCLATRCGDGIQAGGESCDDGNTVSGDGCSIACRVEPGYTCPGGVCTMTVCGNGLKEGSEACDDGNTANGDGCSSTCVQAPGYSCNPGVLCQMTACVGAPNGMIAFPEACDDNNAVNGDGCTNCAVDAGYTCTFMTGGSVCHAVVCGDGDRESNEGCDDGGTANNDGCSSTCQVEPLYSCHFDATADHSVCGPIVQFVEVLRWNISNLNPNAMYFDPSTRSFIAFKNVNSQDPIELCLDGTILGAGYVTPGPARQRPRAGFNQFEDAVYDPFTNKVLMLDGGSMLLYAVPLATLGQGHANLTAADLGTPIALKTTNMNTTLPGTSGGIAVGENGMLYVGTDASNGWYVYPRNPSPSARVPFLNVATGFFGEATTPIQSAFIIPGFDLLGTYTQIGAATPFFDFDSYPQTATTTLSNYTTSHLPSLVSEAQLFATTPVMPFVYTKISDAASTATDGGAFVICGTNPSEPCSLFARTCTTDAECNAVVSGTTCTMGTTPSGTIHYCSAVGNANDDYTSVATNGGAQIVDVLANDTRSEGICANTTVQVQSVTASTRGGTVIVTPGGQSTTYTPPVGFCGGVDTYTYTAALGGNLVDTATVYVLIECLCGDGIQQMNEGCDDGNTMAGDGCSANCTVEATCGNGQIEPGEACDDGNTANGDGCSSLCMLESGCGNGVVEGVEVCDDGNVVSGDGCESNCRPPVCGNGIVEYDGPLATPPAPLEQCDDGNTIDTDFCTNTCLFRIE